MIKDETRRVRQPAAWLLLAGVTISLFVGLMALLSDGFAAAANAGTLPVGGAVAGLTFADRAFVASHALTSVPLTAMAVVAVALATHVGEKVRQARKITLVAVILQGIALLFGVLTWLSALGVPASGSAKLAFFLEGTVGIMIATAGLFFSVVTLRSGELQAGAPACRPASACAAAIRGPLSRRPPGLRLRSARRRPKVSRGLPARQRVSGPRPAGVGANIAGSGGTADCGVSGGRGPAIRRGTRPSPWRAPVWRAQVWRAGGHQGTYGQQAHEAHGQQAPQQHDYQGGYSQQSYGRGYEDRYGPGQSYGQGYAPHGQQGYGQQARDAYQTPRTDVYHSPGTDVHQPPGTDVNQSPGAGTYQPAGHGRLPVAGYGHLPAVLPAGDSAGGPRLHRWR